MAKYENAARMEIHSFEHRSSVFPLPSVGRRRNAARARARAQTVSYELGNYVLTRANYSRGGAGGR
jgi:hypothetical protein